MEREYADYLLSRGMYREYILTLDIYDKVYRSDIDKLYGYYREALLMDRRGREEVYQGRQQYNIIYNEAELQGAATSMCTSC